VRAKPFLFGFFAVVAVLAGVSLYLSLTVDRTDKSFTAVAAPDTKFKAVKIRLTRAGDPPYCFDAIAVILGVYPDDFAERDKAYLVYSAPCAADRALPKIEWQSNTELQISYVKNSAAKPPTLKDHDVTKTVHVTFVEK
jgi:hypothetical protein